MEIGQPGAAALSNLSDYSQVHQNIMEMGAGLPAEALGLANSEEAGDEPEEEVAPRPTRKRTPGNMVPVAAAAAVEKRAKAPMAKAPKGAATEKKKTASKNK